MKDDCRLTMSKRINVMLADEASAALERVTTRGSRSRFISRAVLHYVKSRANQNLREQLKAGYQANARESLGIALEWFPLEEEAWQNSPTKTKG
jgi:CopG family transcriptional regulator / antitoxin EndoAI